MTLPRAILRLGARARGRAWWLRSVDLGVRIIALRGDEILLVRHTYVNGWYLPGGAIDRGETAAGAAARELREETGWACETTPDLHGLFRAGRRGHVACFVARHLRADTTIVVDEREIADISFFPANALPAESTKATRARVAELLAKRPPALDW